MWPKCDVNYWLFNMGKININDKILIKNLQKHKRWSSRKLLKDFPSKGWSRSGLNSLLKRTDAKGNADRVAIQRTSQVSENVSQHRKGRRACLQSRMWTSGMAPNSPVISPVDYAVLGASQQRVYLGRKFESIDELKRALTPVSYTHLTLPTIYSV